MKQTYKILTPIDPINIDKELLQEIENYCFTKLPEYMDIPLDSLKKCYSISIIEGSGEHRFDIIDHYEYSLFPDDISTIIIKLHYLNELKDSLFSMNISLGEDRNSSMINIEIFSTNAREKAIGISENILRILHQKKTLNYFFHPPDNLKIVLILLSTLIPGTAIYLWLGHLKKAVVFLFLIELLIGSYFFILQKLKPYCSFETNRQRKNDKISNFFLLGILGFIFFSTILAYITQFFME